MNNNKLTADSTGYHGAEFTAYDVLDYLYAELVPFFKLRGINWDSVYKKLIKAQAKPLKDLIITKGIALPSIKYRVSVTILILRFNPRTTTSLPVIYFDSAVQIGLPFFDGFDYIAYEMPEFLKWVAYKQARQAKNLPIKPPNRANTRLKKNRVKPYRWEL